MIVDVIYRKSLRDEQYLLRPRAVRREQYSGSSLGELAEQIVALEQQGEDVIVSSEKPYGTVVSPTLSRIQRPLTETEHQLLEGHAQAYREKRTFYLQ